MQHWYVVKSKPGQEIRTANLLQQGPFEVFFPRLRELVYRAHNTSFVLKPLFPSYLFVRADFTQNRNYQLVKFTRGVSHILSTGTVPLPAAPEVVALIRARADLEGVVDIRQQFKMGSIVRVKKGILRDLIGILEKPCPESDRVHVLLSLMNYRMQATFHVSELEVVRDS